MLADEVDAACLPDRSPHNPLMVMEKNAVIHRNDAKDRLCFL